MNKKFSTLLLSGMLLMSTATPVFAEDVQKVNPEVGTAAKPVTVSVTKDLEFAEGITIPTETFNFTAQALPTTPGAPTATITDISYANSDVKADSLKLGKYTVTKKSKIKFGEFPHAGEYNYKVTETNGVTDGMTYSKTTYLLRVYVANDDNNKTYVQNVTAQDTVTQKKSDKVLFTNTFRKNGGQDDGKDSLVIKKETKGALADKTKKFKFNVTFTKSATALDSDTELTGTIAGKDTPFVYDTPNTFELSNGQELTFKKIPAGTTYEVTEVGAEDGYTPSVTVVENGTTTTNTKAANDGDSLSSLNNGKKNLIGEKTNNVTFVNTYKDVPLTGIITKNAPMILVAGAGVLAMFGYALTKRKFAKK